MLRVERFFAALALLLAFGACGSPDPSTPAVAGAPLPPASSVELQPIYEPSLAGLGLEIGSRGGLIDRAGGLYRASETGTHLALYLEPTEEYGVGRYVEGILATAKVFLPDVFERWPGVESFDVCLEPAGWEGEGEPLPVTQVELTREQAAAIEWEDLTLSGMVAASRTDPPGLRLHVSEAIAASPQFRAAAG